MSDLTIRPVEACRYDAVALGEVMLRLDPGESRIRSARRFDVWEGGGEYNVVRGLSSTFGLRVGVVTALVDNEVGRLVESLVRAGGVDTALVRWREFDGVGRAVRNGLNFTERGFGVRGALGVSDRGHTAASQLAPGDVDWDHLFGTLGVRWFHTGGVLAGLSPSTAALAVEAVRAARRHGVVVSYDLNHRPSLWRDAGGPERAQEVHRSVVEHVDVLVGSVDGLGPLLGRAHRPVEELDHDARAELLLAAAGKLPGLRVVAGTVRHVTSASVNGWGATAWSRATGVVAVDGPARLEVLDRVGGGDAFAAGLAYGLLSGEDLPTALRYGVAHGALAVTTPGDAVVATPDEVRRLAAGGGAHVVR